ncbi:hypothetical protein GE061_014153 [Apolygus lucorum]|uniref:Uncharacterized protein n=1 Tax=Apolygus lucorum TaxID=248454 RepID=A0A8S9XPS5_APOLU|nr:hypothetical protein GE061_014153 [Apolygus lucorum]
MEYLLHIPSLLFVDSIRLRYSQEMLQTTHKKMPNTRTKQPGTRCVGAFCAVYGCSNYQGKTKDLGISYHSDLRAELMKCRKMNHLNPGVVPSRNLPLNHPTNSSARSVVSPKVNSRKVLDETDEAPESSLIHYLEYSVTEPGGPSLVKIHTDVVVRNISSPVVYSSDEDSNSKTESEPELEDDEDYLSTGADLKRLNHLLNERDSEILFFELPMSSDEQEKHGVV